MGLTAEQEAHLRHLKREVEITRQRVLAFQPSQEELSANNNYHIACERLRAYRETISD